MPISNNYILRIVFTIVLSLVIISPKSKLYAQDGGVKTIVIDPGHGGKDPGAMSKGGKYKEKDMTLAISLKFGALIKAKYPNIKVIYTRSTDKYITLDERTNIANRNKADLFISVHINATASTSVRGTETFVMGMHKSNANFEVCKKENSVLTIDDDHKTKYEGFDPSSPESYIIFSLLQNTNLEQSLIFASCIQNNFKKGPITNNRGVKQGGLLVLWKTTMPAVLTEVGFISNPNDLKLLISSWGQQQFAQRLFDAFEEYNKEFKKGTSTNKSISNTISNSPNKLYESKSKDDFYAIQILAVNKELKYNAPDLKGEKEYNYIKLGNIYKYYIGNYSSQKLALNNLNQIRKTFKGAFVIHIKDNKIVK